MEETHDPVGQDRQAVAAVRQGDAARYRELVERHERRVYAVAWSRLGDAGLAEEATQEAFVRGYRHLGLLGDGAKFSAWMGTIVRNAAISLGMRQRRELEKRARWALEQPVMTEPAEDAAETARTSETLRQALADLPAAHRECLVLFYIEGKSGAEAAAALGITETALRVRLHRARGALRERMEERLGESLEQLRPGRTFGPSVMAVVMSSSTAKAGGGAGFLATAGAALAKVLPFKVAAVFLPAAFMLPSVALSWWMGEQERKNFRDAKGFRAQLHRRMFWRALWFIPFLMLVMVIAGRWFHGTQGAQMFFLIVGVCGTMGAVFLARRLMINRNQYAVTMAAYQVIVAAGLLVMGFGLLPTAWSNGIIGLGFTIMFLSYDARPTRLDYNLFLRAAQGMLPNADTEPGTGAGGAARSREELLAFARFLGERWLAINYEWTDDGLRLGLPSVANGPTIGLVTMAYFRWSQYSWILLGGDGVVRARCGPRDEQELQLLGRKSGFSDLEMEARVAAAVEQAWQYFRAGEVELAQRAIGQVTDAEVFVKPPTRTVATRWRKGLLALVVVCLVASCLFSLWAKKRHEAASVKPVPVNAAPSR